MAEKTLKPKIAISEIGDSGTYIYNGQIESPDPNRDLVGEKGIDTFNKMRLSDGSVRAAYLACILPILSANWRVDPADDTPEALEIAEQVDADLHDMTRSFDEFLRESLLHLVFGHYVFEIVYELKPDGHVGLRKLAPRLPKSIIGWKTEDGEDGITQLKTDGTTTSIPIEKLLVFINEREGDNWLGTSLLRAAYKPWYMKETLEKIDAIAHERQGVGIPRIKPTQGMTVQKGDKESAIKSAKALRANAEGYLYVPPGYDIEYMDMKGSTTREPLKSAEYHRFEIFLSVLASFLTLGATDSGSRALSQDLSEFFEMSINHVAKVGIAAPINKYLIPRLVDMNHSVDAYPTLTYDGIGSVDFAAITESLERMSRTGTFTPDLDVENALRRAMGLPLAPEDTVYEKPQREEVKEAQLSQHSHRESFLKHYVESESQAIKAAIKELKED